MSKKWINHKLLAIIAATTVLSMLLATGAGAEPATIDDVDISAAAVKEPGALTTPPPPEPFIMSFASFTYLNNCYASASLVNSKTVALKATTYAKQSVDKIGADLTLQRWTGSAWVDVETRPFMDTGNSFVSADSSFTVTTGYYYRAKAYHYVYKGTAFEQTTTYSQEVLAK
ncbi:hypothetical protein [Paenibacillus sp. XY044]|uniref:hypothetical protein n=1 Tax=Paenibacillus sp. XY044 TaxID=2026089 RepID=UPI000B9806C7|nr:hypothetical protein [Paenibacillus sp. XY044]OZB95211.1 hypothetical protein CJP46_16105 [Paenibacillus sp. XY044]